VTGVPAAPTGVKATAGDTTATITWNAVSGATSYSVYRGTAPGAERATAWKTGITSPTFTNTGLTDGTAYYYKVTAVNAAGESAKSAEVSVTPKSATGTGTVTVATRVGANNSAYYGEEDVVLGNTAPITALSVTVTIQKTTGVTYNGQYTTAGSQIAMSHTDAASAVTYQFTLASGQSVGAGTGWTFATQYNGSGTVHPSTGDTYSVTYTSGGVTKTVTGHF
jgi:cellulose 1,4-beta-cellobiosidase